METLKDQGKTLVRDSCIEPETDKTLKEGSRTSGLGSFESVRQNGARVSINGDDDDDDDDDDSGSGLVEVVKSKVVESEISVGDRNIDVVVGSGDKDLVIEDSVINGVSSLLKMRESVIKECSPIMGVIEKEAASDGRLCSSGGGGGGDGVSLVVDICGDAAEIDVKGSRENGDDFNENGGDPNGENEEMSEDNDGDGEEDVDDEEHDFRVGDFVWGKIRSHPWWPGQIYDPLDASDYAVKVRQKDKILVAYFGDGTFAWCNASQLKPFKENFEEMVKQSNSKNFVNAVQKAVDEVGRIVELKMTCSCVPKENLVGLGRPLAVNAGIKEGVYVPEGGIAELLATLFEPEEFLAEMKDIASSASVTNVLEFVVLRSRLSAFYRAKGGYQLLMFHEPQPIPGLEDNIRNWVVDSSEFSDTVDVPMQGPFEDDWHSSPRGPKFGQTSQTLSQKYPGDRLYQRRKQKSIAEIMGGDTDAEAENKEGDMVTEVPNSGKSASSERKKRKGSDEANGDGVNGSKSVSRRRKETKLIESPMTTDSKVPSVENDSSGAKEETKKGVLSSRRKKNKGSDAENGGGGVKEANNGPLSRARRMKGDSRVKSDDGEAKEQTEKGFLSRDRKKSKYLSPPYTNISKGHRKKEIEEESLEVSNEARLHERMTRAASHLVGSPPIFKRTDATTKKKQSKEVGIGHEASDNSSPQALIQGQNKVIDPMKVKAPTKEVLSGIRAAALSPQFFKENNSVEVVGEFLSIFRSSVYCDGSNYKTDSQHKRGRKRKSLNSEPGSSRKDHNQTDHKSPEHKSRRTTIKKIEEVKTNEPKPRKKEEAKSDKSKLKKNEEPGSDKSRKLKKNEELKSNKSKKLKEIEKTKSDKTKLKKNEAAKLDEHKLKESASTPDVETNDEETVGAASPAQLFVTFGPGSSLPTKNDLIKIYSKFGALDKKETDMFYNNFCARVVFIRTSDAEKAFNSSQNASPFGTSNVSFRLRYLSAASKTRDLREIESSSPKPAPQTKEGGKTPEKSSASRASAGELNYIREKLEMMTSMLANSDEKMSPEMKSRLESEMKGLYKKVTTMVGSSSS